MVRPTRSTSTGVSLRAKGERCEVKSEQLMESLAPVTACSPARLADSQAIKLESTNGVRQNKLFLGRGRPRPLSASVHTPTGCADQTRKGSGITGKQHSTEQRS